MAAVAAQGQTISFCWVNAHFQNGKAERRIRTLQDLGRTQLLHAMARWPVALGTQLWPYAITNVANCQNDLRQTGQRETRMERFSGSRIAPNLKNHHHVGIPAYVLDNQLQSRHKISKWLPRARVGIYLGKLPRHARNIALVLNPRSGLVSAQFHVKFDDTFQTLRGTKDESHSLWKIKCGFVGNQVKRPILKPLEINKETKIKISKDKEMGKIMNEEITDEMPIHNNFDIENFEIMLNEGARIQENVQQEEQQEEMMSLDGNQPLRRSSRVRTPTRGMLESVAQENISLPISLQIMKAERSDENFLDYVHPILLAASSDPDTMYWDQALKQPDKQQFIDAALKEISTHQEQGHWKLVP
jgi:hypothetical protein